MKKFIAIFLMMLLALGCAASAEDLGVQVIGGEETETVPVSLDDLQIGTVYTIDGYAKIEPVAYLVVDWFGQFNKDANYSSTDLWYNQNAKVYYDADGHYYREAAWQESGTNAEFAWLKLDVTNMDSYDYSDISDDADSGSYDDSAFDSGDVSVDSGDVSFDGSGDSID